MKPVALLLLPLIAGIASADITAYNVAAGTVGNQNYGGSLGLDFNVTSATGVTVGRLGVFDSGSDGLNLPLTARLYDRTTGLQVPGGVLTFATGPTGTLEGGSRFLNLAAPLNLPAGFQGTIVGEGYGATELVANGSGAAVPWTTNGGVGKISFVGSGRFGAAGAFPASPDGGPFNRYAAGTFGFDTNPSTGSVWTALSRPTAVAGVQDYGGSLGADFAVNGSGAIITSLGAFDSNGDGILNGGITTQLWLRNNNGTPNDTADDTGTLITSEIFSAALPGTLEGSYRFKPLAAPLSLAPGDYTIVAFGYDGLEQNGNIFTPDNVPYNDEGNGTISFVGRSRYGAAGAFPNTADTIPVQYMAGSFKFSAIPEPSGTVLAGLFAGTVLLRRRR